jgi:vitamin B12 transporter
VSRFISIRRAAVPVAIACLIAQVQAQAQSQPVAAPLITVTATRTPVPVAEVLADITVIDRATIERATGRTLVELLSQQPGLQLSSNGGLGKTSSLFIRGLEGRHTLLLVDGVRVYSATVGTPSFDNLPLEAIERIEIVRGPMSALYGSGAVGGVVQVFTRSGAQGLSGNVKAVVGTHDYGQASGGVSFGNGVFDVAAQVQHVDDKGVSATNSKVPFGSYNPDRDGFRQAGGSVRLGWRPVADWRVEALALQSHGKTAIDDGPGADARAALDSNLALLSARGTVMPGWTSRLSASTAVDAYETLASASAFTDIGAIQSQVRQFAWENTVATPVGAALVLVDRLQETVSRPKQAFTVSSRHIDGVALGLNGSAAGHSWQGSLRRDHNSQFGGNTTGALGYGYAVLPALRVGGSVGQSYVAPSFNQLYYPSFGNPLLLPEEGKHAELNARYVFGEQSLKATVFRNRYRGFITSGPAPVNLPLATINGMTIAYEGRWRDVDLSASYDHTDPRNATVGNVNFDKLLQRRSRDTLRLGADWQADAWKAGVTAAGYSYRYDNTANTARLGGYATLDLRAEWQMQRGLFLGLKLNNAADKHYETALGYDQPGREGFVTLRYTR